MENNNGRIFIIISKKISGICRILNSSSTGIGSFCCFVNINFLSNSQLIAVRHSVVMHCGTRKNIFVEVSKMLI